MEYIFRLKFQKTNRQKNENFKDNSAKSPILFLQNMLIHLAIATYNMNN